MSAQGFSPASLVQSIRVHALGSKLQTLGKLWKARSNGIM